MKGSFIQSLIITSILLPIGISAEANWFSSKTDCSEKEYSTKELTKRSKPGVVTITTDKANGSGFVVRHINNQTLILTNSHVLKGARDIIVSWPDGNQDSAVVVLDGGATTTLTDLALLKVEGKEGKILPLKKEPAIVGVDVIAIGAPQGFSFSLTKGVISSLRDEGRIVQTDTAVNKGSSGGPLINSSGCVVGVNTLGGQNDAMNINFAISSQIAQRFVDKYDPNNPSKTYQDQESVENKKQIIKTQSSLDEPTFIEEPSYLGCELKIVSGRFYNTDQLSLKKFSEDYGVKICLIQPTGISTIEKLIREGSSLEADVILLVDVLRASLAKKSGLFQPISSGKLYQLVPRKYRDPDGHWFGITRRIRNIVVNPSIVDPETINSYADLADPSLKGKLCLRRRNSPYNVSLVADYLLLNGEESTRKWIKGMVFNNEEPYLNGDVASIRAVAQEKCGVTIVNHYYVARMLAEINGRRDKILAKRIAVITPYPANVNISVAGIGKYSRNKKQAFALLSYLASSSGSRAIAGPTFEHPIRGLNEHPIVQNFGPFTPSASNLDQIGDATHKAEKLMREYGWQ